MKRILLTIIMISVIIIGGTGCMFTDEPKKDVNDLALEHMEQKYGESFTYHSSCGSSYTGTRTFFATFERLGDFKILVQIENYKNNNKVFSDNYLSGKYETNTYTYFKNITDDIFGDSKVFYTPFASTLSADLSADTTFEEYLADANGAFSVVMVVKKSHFTDKTQFTSVIDIISSSVAANDLSVILTVVDDCEYENIDEKKTRSMVVTGEYIYCAKLTRDGNFSDSVILEGKINE